MFMLKSCRCRTSESIHVVTVENEFVFAFQVFDDIGFMMEGLAIHWTPRQAEVTRPPSGKLQPTQALRQTLLEMTQRSWVGMERY